jgi:hypothetical protein
MWPFRKPKKSKFVPKMYVIFNVDTFNTWFNSPDNEAVYAHPGIFLRLDKLDVSQINDYLVKCHGLNLDEWDIDEEVWIFREEILNDWREKLKEQWEVN